MHEGIVRMQSPGVRVPRADEVFEEDLSFSERAAVARRLAKIQVRVRSFFERFFDHLEDQEPDLPVPSPGPCYGGILGGRVYWGHPPLDPPLPSPLPCLRRSRRNLTPTQYMLG